MAEFPHCNSSIVHAPRVCFYCDKHPDLQAARALSGKDYDSPEANGWSGNVAVQAGATHSHMGATWTVGEDIDEHWEDNYNVVEESEAWLSIHDAGPGVTLEIVDSGVRRRCCINMKRSWRCIFLEHADGPCGLVPKWWNWGSFARRYRKAYR